MLYGTTVSNEYDDIVSHPSTITRTLKAIIHHTHIPKENPDSEATRLFGSNKHKHLGKELPHEKMRVGVANTKKMDSITTRQLRI